MTSPQRPVLAPQYAFRFSCIGSECEDTCCQGWRISIDERTYKRYRRLQHPELRPLLDKAIKRNRSNPTPRNYANLKLNANGMCPLLSSDGLCKVHKELGTDYLSTICAVYPRITRMVDNTLEHSLTLSCPEAARLALLNPKPMEFDFDLLSTNVHTKAVPSVNTTSLLSRNLEPHFWDIRRVVIGLLQDRSYAVWERMVILGLFLQKVEQLEQGGDHSLEELMDRFRAIVKDGSLRESLAGIPSQSSIQIKLAKELVDQRLSQGINSQRYLECVSQVLAGLQITIDATDESIGQRYLQAYTDYFAPFMTEREYIFENFLVNYVFKNLFPLGSRGIFGEYVMLAIHYSLIKMHLIGLAAFHKGLSEELVIKLIYSFSRVIEHDASYLHYIYDLIKDSGLATMTYMTILIKN